MALTTVECITCFSIVYFCETVCCSSITPHFFCFECMSNYINSYLDQYKINLKCINTETCTAEFYEDDLPRFMNCTDLDRFSKIQQELNVKSAFGNKLVSCPSCSIQIVNDNSEDMQILICPNKQCKYISCIRCKKEYHWSSECSMATRNRIEKEEKETYQIIKSCPNCNVDIFKTEGCNHVRCICGKKICYLCGEDITYTVLSHGCRLFDINITPEEIQNIIRQHQQAV